MYLINEKGDIFSTIKNRLLRPYKNNKGYLNTSLYLNNSRYRFLVHRLVALNFIENYENKDTVNHKDGNKLNNDISNLEWMSNEENLKHSYVSGIRKRAQKRFIFKGRSCQINTYYKKIGKTLIK